jgi:hypothetical protein
MYNLLGNRESHNCTPFFKLAVAIKFGSTGLNFADEKFGTFGQYILVLTGQGTASTVCSKTKRKKEKMNFFHLVHYGPHVRRVHTREKSLSSLTQKLQ